MDRTAKIITVVGLSISTLLMIGLPFVLFYALFGWVGVILGGIGYTLFSAYFITMWVRMRRRKYGNLGPIKLI